MHRINSKTIAVSLAVGAAMVSLYPANLNAITAATPYPLSTIQATNTLPAAATPAPAALAQPAPQGNLAIEEPTPMDVWLAKLEYQESRGQHYIKVLDVNGRYSYGCLQFQEATFRSYALKYGLILPSTPTEHVIYSCQLQKKLARLMIAEDYSNWRAWYTSVRLKSVGLPPLPQGYPLPG